ncbi:plant/protein [Wolffia australiana]
MAAAAAIGLSPYPKNLIFRAKPITRASTRVTFMAKEDDPSPPSRPILDIVAKGSPLLAAAAITLPSFISPDDALAVGGELGILEGRTLALVHPVVMGGLFVYTLWSGYLGWQWRRVRTIQDEINELKKQVKPAPTAVLSSGATASSSPPPPPSPIEEKIQQLTEERKNLLKGSFRDRHFNAGSILLGFGVLESVGGCLNTWFRTGKLFPGPHLFAGAAITVLWALAAALVPAMQKGNETARNLHIALNALNVLLFAWQIPTGIEIVLKVFEFTKWP